MARDRSQYAGKTVTLRADAKDLGGQSAAVVDWYENTGKKLKWRDALSSRADQRAESYNMRRALAELPDDDRVLLAKVDGMTQIIHLTEIEGADQSEPTTPFGPQPVDPREIGQPCIACNRRFVREDFVWPLTLGPGLDKDNRKKAKEGKQYHTLIAELHWACVTGDETYEVPEPAPDPDPVPDPGPVDPPPVDPGPTDPPPPPIDPVKDKDKVKG